MIGAVLDVMKTMAKEGMARVCVTHEMGFARDVADSVMFTDEGAIVENNAAEPGVKRPVWKTQLKSKE